MKVDLTSEEMALLIEELKYRLGTIREEVYHAETYDFKDLLKRKKAVLKSLIEKVSTAHKAAEAGSKPTSNKQRKVAS